MGLGHTLTVLRQFLPAKYGVEVNALIIDRLGRVSRQADIVIYDAENQARFFRKVYPVEIIYAVIEVKTSMSSSEAKASLENLASVSELEFRPALSPYWETRTREEDIHHSPPGLYVFAFRTDCRAFETFAGWIDWQYLHRGVKLRDSAPTYPEIRVIRVCALDQGTIFMESTNGYVQRYVAVAQDEGVTRWKISRNGPARFRGNGPTLDGLPAEPRFESSTRPFSLRQVSGL